CIALGAVGAAGRERGRRNVGRSRLDTGHGRVLRWRRRVARGCHRSRSGRRLRRAAPRVARAYREELTMFRAILFSQWKWSRLIVVLGTVAGFAVPLVSLQGAARADRSPLEAEALLHPVQGWGVLYPLLVTALGL